MGDCVSSMRDRYPFQETGIRFSKKEKPMLFKKWICLFLFATGTLLTPAMLGNSPAKTVAPKLVADGGAPPPPPPWPKPVGSASNVS